MSDFEDNLWREVQRTYGAELSDAPDPLHRRSRLRSPVLAGTSLGVIGGSVAAVILLTAASSSPAFAVTRHSDGTVSLVIRRIEGIAGANRRLALLGIRARAVAVSGVCTAAPPGALARVTVATIRGRSVNWVGATPGKMAERIRPAQIPAGRTLVIPTVPGGAAVRLVHGRAVSGPVPACLPPVVFFGRAVQSAGGRIVICRAGIAPGPGTIVIGRGAGSVSSGTKTNSTGTNATSTGTDTNSTGTTATDGTPTNGSWTRPAPSQVPIGAGTNTSAETSTNASTGTTEQGTSTNGTATNAATTTDGAATPGSPPAGAVGRPLPPLPPPLLRHCQLNAERLALGAATARAQADHGAIRKSRP